VLGAQQLITRVMARAVPSQKDTAPTGDTIFTLTQRKKSTDMKRRATRDNYPTHVRLHEQHKWIL
jgi:hypothetical protein